MYALIIAREIPVGNTEQPIAVKSRLGRSVPGPNQNSTPTLTTVFATPVKATTNNFLKTSKLDGTWKHLAPEH